MTSRVVDVSQDDYRNALIKEQQQRYVIGSWYPVPARLALVCRKRTALECHTRNRVVSASTLVLMLVLAERFQCSVAKDVGLGPKRERQNNCHMTLKTRFR